MNMMLGRVYAERMEKEKYMQSIWRRQSICRENDGGG
jgi:hypothetical protein